MSPPSAIRRFPLTFLPLAALLLALSAGSGGAQEVGSFENPLVIQLQGPITPLLEQYLYRKLKIAESRGADLIILEVDSPGGFKITSTQMADRLRDLKWARTVAYVPREAISGAAIISLGCDDIVMAPRAKLGDAGEIMMDADNAFRYVPEKERSVLASQIRDLADAKGRPPALAEAMVNMDLVVYRVRNKETGETWFMSDAEIASSDNPDQWEKGPPVHESREKHFLTVNGEQAVDLLLARATVEDREGLKELYGISGRLPVMQQTGIDTAVTILNSQFITGLLIVVGLIALYVEFSAPGIGIGALVSLLCFSLFFWSRFLGGTAGWLEVVLFGVGVIFLLMELFVIPGFGVAGFSGLGLMVVSVLMASQHFLIPSTDLEMSKTLGSLMVIVASGFISILAAIVISHFYGSIPVVSWLVLKPPAQIAGKAKAEEVAQPSSVPSVPIVGVGDEGIAESALRPAGRALFGQSHVDVVADGSFVTPGQLVRVIEVSGNRVVVREVE